MVGGPPGSTQGGASAGSDGDKRFVIIMTIIMSFNVMDFNNFN
ncbi:hypothetical protein [Clostridioides difficile]|nr:hypothetical protein [Clostridioides difficile]